MIELMSWNSAGAVLEQTVMPQSYNLRQMAREDVPEITTNLRLWYPDIVVGSESCHLSEDFYYRNTALLGQPGEWSIFPIVVKHGDVPVGMITYERNVDARTITSRMGALSAEHRGSGLALLGPILLEKIGRAMGAELAYYYATLKSRDQQVLAERMRFTLVGIVPAFDRDMIRPGEVRRVHEAIYAKVLAGAEALAPPERETLTRRTKAVWDVLFGI